MKLIIKSTVGKDKCSTGKMRDKNTAVCFKKRKKWILARANSNLHYVNLCKNLVTGNTHLSKVTPLFGPLPSGQILEHQPFLRNLQGLKSGINHLWTYNFLQ